MSCPSCGAELGGETVLDDVHAIDTVLIGPRGRAGDDTAPDIRPIESAPPTKTRGASNSEPPTVAARSDDGDDHVTAQVASRPSVAVPPPTGAFSSSEPPTRFLRGTEQHIELPSGSVVDDYEIEAKLGEGAMGIVYAARHLKLGRRVAVKVIAPRLGADPQALARFEREARALASLHHPNIVDVFSFGALPDGRSYFVMEYLVGEALDEQLASGCVPLGDALDIVDQMARALEAAHAQGVIHRDLKPSNTFLVRIPREQRSVVKLLDFGLAKLAVADGLEQTASGVVIGTALYLSPEQCRGPNVDGRTDIYALGCVAYELILGRHPFPEARTPTAAIAAHLTQPAPQPRTIWPGIPAALDLLLSSLLAKDPNYRPTLAQVRNMLTSLRSPSTTEGRAIRAATEVVPHGPRTRLWIAALVAIALLVGIAIGASVVGGRPMRGAARPPAPPTMATGSTLAVPTSTPSSAVAIPPPVPDASLAAASQAKPAATEKPVVRPARPAPPQADEGVLVLESKPWTDVLVDGERRGRTPVTGLRLPVGRHRITLLNARYSIKESFRVEIEHGRVEKIVKDYSDRPEVKEIDDRTKVSPIGASRGVP